MQGTSYFHHYNHLWWEWPGGVSLEQLEAIEWILIGGRRREVERTTEGCSRSLNYGLLKRMKGLKVIIKKVPIQGSDEEVIDDLARHMGCRVVDEEMIELTGVYETVPRRSC